MVKPQQITRQVPDKSVTRYLKVDASNIQTFPYVATEGAEITSQLNMGTSLGKPIQQNDYIMRITSKDTGRKIDIKLNFIVKVDGSPINR
jgi:hypothetical protein